LKVVNPGGGGGGGIPMEPRVGPLPTDYWWGAAVLKKGWLAVVN